MTEGPSQSSSSPATSDIGAAVYVCIGLPEGIAEALAGTQPMVHLSLAGVSKQGLSNLKIAMVACPLMADGLDALMVAQSLHQAGYTGVLTVIAPSLPNPKMVETELRGASPGIRVNVICL